MDQPGTVRGFRKISYFTIDIEFDNYIGGHGDNNPDKPGHSWNFNGGAYKATIIKI